MVCYMKKNGHFNSKKKAHSGLMFTYQIIIII